MAYRVEIEIVAPLKSEAKRCLMMRAMHLQNLNRQSSTIEAALCGVTAAAGREQALKNRVLARTASRWRQK